MPGAEMPGGVEIAAPVSRYLSAAPARVRAVVRLALRVVDLPVPLARLSPERRAARLRRLERSRIGVLRDLVLLPKTLCSIAYARDPSVAAAVGVTLRCERRPGALDGFPPAPPPLDPGALRAPDGVERCDVVVVGSGAGGAAAARLLAERGLSVIVVEEGLYRDARGYSTDPFEALPALYRDAGLTVCEGRPAIPLPVGRCVGGTTVVNSGTCFRTPADVLLRWRDEFGIPWATELGERFEALERDLHVQPVDPATAGRNAELCRVGAEALGAQNGPLFRNAAGVDRCATCPTGCALDARQAAHVSELPRAVAAGARVRAGQRVERVLLEGERAAGVSCGGYEVRARAVVLAAGALGTPGLLLSQGIGNRSGAVGRHLRIHPACWVGARHEQEVRGWEGVMQSWHVGEWREHGLFLEATATPPAFGAHWLPGAGAELTERIERYGNLAVIGVHLSDRSEGRVRARGRGVRVSYRLRPDDAQTIAYGIARAAEIHFAAGATEVYPQIARAGVWRRGERGPDTERVRPRDLRLEAFHPMGTARMGADPASTVVSPSGELHDVPGLFAADASIFPTSLAVNPMITIMACARVVAAGLADRLE